MVVVFVIDGDFFYLDDVCGVLIYVSDVFVCLLVGVGSVRF